MNKKRLDEIQGMFSDVSPGIFEIFRHMEAQEDFIAGLREELKVTTQALRDKGIPDAFMEELKEVRAELEAEKYSRSKALEEINRLREGWKQALTDKNTVFAQSLLNLSRAEKAEKSLTDLREDFVLATKCLVEMDKDAEGWVEYSREQSLWFCYMNFHEYSGNTPYEAVTVACLGEFGKAPDEMWNIFD